MHRQLQQIETGNGHGIGLPADTRHVTVSQRRNTGKSGVTILADGAANIVNAAPEAGANGAFDLSGQSDWTIHRRAPEGFGFDRTSITVPCASNWAVGDCISAVKPATASTDPPPA
jgi:hypothetical protein